MNEIVWHIIICQTIPFFFLLWVISFFCFVLFSLIKVKTSFNYFKNPEFQTKTIKKCNFYFHFLFRELMGHTNVTFNNNGTLSSAPRHPLVFDEERSVGRSENDTLILPNVALLVSHWTFFFISFCFFFLKKHWITTNRILFIQSLNFISFFRFQCWIDINMKYSKIM